MKSSPELRQEAWRYIEAVTNSMSKEESRQLMARAFELAQMAAEIEAPKMDPSPSKGQGRDRDLKSECRYGARLHSACAAVCGYFSAAPAAADCLNPVGGGHTWCAGLAHCAGTPASASGPFQIGS